MIGIRKCSMNALYRSTCMRGHSVAEAGIIRNCCEIVARMYWKFMMSSRFHRNLLSSNIMHFMYKAHIYQPCKSITIKSICTYSNRGGYHRDAFTAGHRTQQSCTCITHCWAHFRTKMLSYILKNILRPHSRNHVFHPHVNEIIHSHATLRTGNASASPLSGVPSPPHMLSVTEHSATWVTVSWQPPEFAPLHEVMTYK